jgi:hypothetical protein
MSKLTKTELKDRAALGYLRDHPRAITTKSIITKLADQATTSRLIKRGWTALPDNAEFTDQLAITGDGLDYLTELEQPWNN